MPYHRKVIRIKAEDSPNVELALRQIQLGMQPTGEIILPGVLSWEQYVNRRKTWDEVRQAIGLDAIFWEGPDQLLFPPDWLDEAERQAKRLRSYGRRQAVAIGMDPGEGGDDSVWTVVDKFGVIYQEAMKTPDTSIIPNRTIALMKEYNVNPDRTCFDRGGGGYEHTCELASRGFKVRSVGFGERVVALPQQQTPRVPQRIEDLEERYAYSNRRAQMYWEAAQLFNPKKCLENGHTVFGLPEEYDELRRQLALIPKRWDKEGQFFIPPKQAKSGMDVQDRLETLNKLIGRSPDHADSFVLAVHGMLHEERQRIKGRSF